MIAAWWWAACSSTVPAAPGGLWFLVNEDPDTLECAAEKGDHQTRKQRKDAWDRWYACHETALLELVDDGNGGVSGTIAGEDRVDSVDGVLADGVGALEGRDAEAKLKWTATIQWTAETVTMTMAEDDIVWYGARCSFEDRCDDRCYVD